MKAEQELKLREGDMEHEYEQQVQGILEEINAVQAEIKGTEIEDKYI